MPEERYETFSRGGSINQNSSDEVKQSGSENASEEGLASQEDSPLTKKKKDRLTADKWGIGEQKEG